MSSSHKSKKPNCPVEVVRSQFNSLQEQAHQLPDNQSASSVGDSVGSITGVMNFHSEVSEYQQAEETRQADETLFRRVIEQASDGFVLVNEQGVIVVWNYAQERNSGIPRTEAIGQYIWDIQFRLMLPEQRTPAAYNAAKRHVCRLLSTHTSPYFHRLYEAPVQRSDGERGIWQYAIFPVQSDSSFIVGCTIRDVTPQKHAEEALRDSEERFRAVFDLAQDAIYIKNRDMVYTHVNPIVEEQNNKCAAEIIGKTAEYLFKSDPEAAAQTKAVDLRVLAGEVVEQIRTKPTGGIPRTYHNIKVPIRNKSGEIIGLCAFARDITEWQRATEQLKESEERYRALVNSLPVGIFVIEDGKYVFSNPAGAKLLGIASQDDILGMQELEPVVSVDHDRIQQLIHAVPEQAIPPMEITLNRVDGGSIDIESTVVPIQIAGKNVVLVISQDITERKLSQERTLALVRERRQSQLLTEFIQNVSHEFRTPISIINTSAYLLSKMADSPRQLEKIQQLEEQTEHIAHLIRAMLTMSRLDSGIAPNFAPLDINQLVEMILVGVRDEADKKQLTMHFESTPQLVLTGDQDDLYQGLLNIFENAVRFNESGGTITVRVLGDTNWVTLTVADTGMGINPEDLPHVYERFYRADKARSTRGAGLGLSIVRKIVERHQGTINIDSTPGQGTIVTITLPRQ